MDQGPEFKYWGLKTQNEALPELAEAVFDIIGYWEDD